MPRIVPLILFIILPLAIARAGEPKYKLSDIPSAEEKANAKTAAEGLQVPNTAELANQIAEEFYQKGSKALSEGNLELAEGYFDRVLILEPRHKGAKEGIDVIMKAYENPTALPVTKPTQTALIKKLENEMNEKLAAGDREGADAVADEILAIDPGHNEARQKQSVIQRQFYREALAQADEQEKDGDFQGAINSLRVALSYKKDQSLRTRIKELRVKASRDKDEMSDKLYVEALEASQNDETEKAITLCRQALSLNPSNHQAQRMLDRLTR